MGGYGPPPGPDRKLTQADRRFIRQVLKGIARGARGPSGPSPSQRAQRLTSKGCERCKLARGTPRLRALVDHLLPFSLQFFSKMGVVFYLDRVFFWRGPGVDFYSVMKHNRRVDLYPDGVI